jgi:hypothetical protein
MVAIDLRLVYILASEGGSALSSLSLGASSDSVMMRRFMMLERPSSMLWPYLVNVLSKVGDGSGGTFCTNWSARPLMWLILPSSQLSVCLRPYCAIGGQSVELTSKCSGV